MASAADVVGSVALTGFVALCVAIFTLLAGSLLAWLCFKARRWYRIVKAAGASFDDDGLRVLRHPEHGFYYVRHWSVLMPLPNSPTGWWTSDPKWCVGYSGKTGNLYVTRRSRPSRRIPKWARDLEDLEDWRPVMESLDRYQHPWRTEELDESVGQPSLPSQAG